jgi:membrane protein DedA with SNARE-associated domain
MPEDIVLITAGVLGAQNGINVIKTILLMYIGIVLGDGLIFMAGRLLGYRLLKTRIAQVLIHPEKFGNVQTLFGKWGLWVVFVGRFLPGLRTPIFFTAGTLKYPPLKFFFMDGFAALISAPLFVWLGHWAWLTFGEDFERVEKAVGTTKIVILVIIVIALIGGIVSYFTQKKRRRGRE